VVVLLIAGLVAAVVIAYNKFSWFRDAVKSVWEWLKKAWDFAGKVMSAVGNFFGGKQSAFGGVTINGGGDGGGPAGGGGVYGGPSGGPPPARVYGAAAMSSGGGASGVGSPAGSGAPTTVINVTVQGAIDPMGTARTIVSVLKDYSVLTGGQVAITIGGRA